MFKDNNDSNANPKLRNIPNVKMGRRFALFFNSIYTPSCERGTARVLEMAARSG